MLFHKMVISAEFYDHTPFLSQTSTEPHFFINHLKTPDGRDIILFYVGCPTSVPIINGQLSKEMDKMQLELSDEDWTYTETNINQILNKSHTV